MRGAVGSSSFRRHRNISQRNPALRLIQSGDKSCANTLDFRALCHLKAVTILDVKNIHRLGAIGRNMRCDDRKAELGQGAADIIEQTRPVASVDLDHRVLSAGAVIYQNP